MNYVSLVDKRCRDIEGCWGKIATEGAREMCRVRVRDMYVALCFKEGENAKQEVVETPVVVPVAKEVEVVIPSVLSPVEWPGEAGVRIMGKCPNPRLLTAVLEDGRRVSVENGGYAPGSSHKAVLLRGGGSPVYRVIKQPI